MADTETIYGTSGPNWAQVFEASEPPLRRRAEIVRTIAEHGQARFVRETVVRVPDTGGNMHQISPDEYTEWLNLQAGRLVGVSYAGENPVPAEGQGPLPADYRNLPA